MRKHWTLIVAVSLFVYSTLSVAIDLELTQGVNKAFPIAIESLGHSMTGERLSEVIRHDLSLMGQFKLVTSSTDHLPLDAWQRLGADSVVSGRVEPLSNGRWLVHVALSDVAMKGRPLWAQEFQVDAMNIRRLGHHISDEIYQKLTGVKGVFSTRIAYILVKRTAAGSRYSLDIADMDGGNPRSLLISTDPIMSPAWSPDGRSIAYVSFEKKRAQIFTVSVETGQRRLLTDFPGINGAPAWSPDGRSLAIVLSKTGVPKVYIVDLSSGGMKQVTFGDAIDTEPRFSPDGRSLLFTSGRGGSPQIYQMNRATGMITRITFDGTYNAKASFTPNQQDIVMLHRGEDRGFNIGVLHVGDSRILSLTHSSADESPTIAPNGRLVMYATRVNDQGRLGLVSIDGRASLLLPSREGDIQEPAWSPF